MHETKISIVMIFLRLNRVLMLINLKLFNEYLYINILTQNVFKIK